MSKLVVKMMVFGYQAKNFVNLIIKIIKKLLANFLLFVFYLIEIIRKKI